MKKFLIGTSAMLAAAALIPASAQAQGVNWGGASSGAVLGGVIGSNLAGSGVQQEGTAIGALIGGLAGNAIANNRSSRYGSNGNYGTGYSSYNGTSYGSGYNGSPYGTGYGSGYNAGGYRTGGQYPVGYGAIPAAPVRAPYFTGNYVSSPVFTRTTIVQRPVYTAPAPVAPTVVYRQAPTPAPKTVYVDLPAPEAETVYVERQAPTPAPRTVYVDVPAPEAEVIYVERQAPTPAPIIKYVEPTPAPVVCNSTPTYGSTQTYNGHVETAPCPTGSTAQADGTCLQSGSVQTHSYPTGNVHTGTTGCSTSGSAHSYAPSYGTNYSAGIETAPCPSGTSKQSDGTCLDSSASYSGYLNSSPTSTPDAITYGGHTSQVYGTGSYTQNSDHQKHEYLTSTHAYESNGSDAHVCVNCDH